MQAYALTDTGRVRSMNQDYIYASPETVGSLPNLFLVSEGMGGHQAGDYASRKKEGAPVPLLSEGIREINTGLYSESLNREELNGMGCTLVAAVVDDGILYAANIGDSRLYLIHENEIRQVTKDHSYVEEMVALGKMVRGSADYNRRKNIITRALGIGKTVEADFFEVELEPGDYILLCSDGLTNMVSDERIRAVVAGSGTLKEKARRLICEANEGGGMDNIAVVLVEPEEGGTGPC